MKSNFIHCFNWRNHFNKSYSNFLKISPRILSFPTNFNQNIYNVNFKEYFLRNLFISIFNV